MITVGTPGHMISLHFPYMYGMFTYIRHKQINQMYRSIYAIVHGFAMGFMPTSIILDLVVCFFEWVFLQRNLTHVVERCLPFQQLFFEIVCSSTFVEYTLDGTNITNISHFPSLKGCTRTYVVFCATRLWTLPPTQEHLIKHKKPKEMDKALWGLELLFFFFGLELIQAIGLLLCGAGGTI